MRLVTGGWRALDRELRSRFTGSEARLARAGEGAEAVRLRHEHLAGYFTQGFLHYRLPPGSLARYPGASSTNGRRADRIEGFTRMAPLLASWVSGRRPSAILLPGGGEVRPLELLAQGIEAGTDPEKPGYWGPLRHRHQLLAEAADVALSLWLAREELWSALTPAGRWRVIRWLKGGIDRDVKDNNWHLFPVLIWSALRSLGEKGLPDHAAWSHYRRFKEFHLGHGWFRDGPGGAVDYYNAWQMHYALFWLGRQVPSFDGAFRDEVRHRFVDGYHHLMGPSGFPILGRSVCYRVAAPAPLVAAALEGTPSVPPGMARRALDRTWAHFIRHGAVERGRLTQGYGRADLRFLDNYSGPASPLWSLRALIVALHAPVDHPFWTAPDEPLPVEKASYHVRIPAIGWRISADERSREIAVLPGGSSPSPGAAQGYPPWRRALDWWRGCPQRPENRALKTGLGRYSSTAPFCGYG